MTGGILPLSRGHFLALFTLVLGGFSPRNKKKEGHFFKLLADVRPLTWAKNT
jgi:hypothetical protein